MLHDLVIREALVIDGTGAEPFVADIAIDGDRVVRIGAVARSGHREIVASGAAASPGFIDVHTHDDRLALIAPAMEPKVSQGITTIVTGNCGISLSPRRWNGEPLAPLTLLGGERDFRYPTFSSYSAELRDRGCAVNVVPLVGHTALRASVLDDCGRHARPDEIRAMEALVDEAMAAGAIGLSSGVYYPPAAAASTDEIAPLLRRVALRSGIYATHIRDEGDGLMASLDEALDCARQGGVPLQISHLKCASPKVWGLSGKVLARIEREAATYPVGFDVYPYEASSTMLRPDRLADATRVMVSWSQPHPDKAGQDLAEIARCWCCSPEEAASRLSPGGGIYYKMQERDVRRILTHPMGMIGSDGLPHDTHPHPRLWGTFPRILGHYVRDLRLMPLVEAVRKMTSLPAAAFGLMDRGVLREGAFADISLFDPLKIADTATFEVPASPARGIDTVIANGEVVWALGRPTGRRPGRVLARAASRNLSPRPRRSSAVNAATAL